MRNRNIRKLPIDAIEDEGESNSMLLRAKKSGMPKQSASAESTKNDSKNVYFQYDSCKEIQVQNDSKSTATLETETDFSRDARAIRELVLKQDMEALKGTNKVYRGIHHYTDYRAGFRREQTVAAEKAGGAHGPLRASAYIRTSTRFDFQLDICKDYKQTGYCGYGDSCKFVHDRDYKSGREMEKKWEEAEKARKRNFTSEDFTVQEETDGHDSLPSACSICEQYFVDPVVTNCKHYFCGRCALKHHSRNKKCFVCNLPTEGTFTHKIRKRMGGS